MFDFVRTGDPVRDADDYLERAEFRYGRWLDKCPSCAICHKPVIGDEAIVLNPGTVLEEVICYPCKVEQTAQAMKVLNPYIVEILQDALDNLVTNTPHEVA